jgi:hypothetical protein
VGLPVSLILIAIGAILAFAVHQDPNAAVNVHAVGWILMAVGFVGLLLSLFWWERWGPGYWAGERRAYGGPRYAGAATAGAATAGAPSSRTKGRRRRAAPTTPRRPRRPGGARPL